MPEAQGASATRLASLSLTLATAAWPLLVYASAGRVSPRAMIAGICALLLLRVWLSRRDLLVHAAGAMAALLLLGSLGNAWLSVRLYPCAISAAMLLVFGASLLRPPSIIERIARLRDPALPPEAVGYTRAVTMAWCVFFVANGGTAAWIAVYGSSRTWALYNGVISYGLMGCMFGGEMLVRRFVMARVATSARHG